MPIDKLPQCDITPVSPYGVDRNDDGTVGLTFLKENGDHLHLLLDRAGLQTLFHDISAAIEQGSSPSAQQSENSES